VTIQTHGGSYGQGFSSGACANWHVLVENNSSEEVVDPRYRAASGNLDNSDYTKSRKARRPAAVSVPLSIPAHDAQELDFQSCTQSEVPNDWEYNDIPPEAVEVSWITGYRERVCFGRCALPTANMTPRRSGAGALSPSSTRPRPSTAGISPTHWMKQVAG
jgi:hypothetical protein